MTIADEINEFFKNLGNIKSYNDFANFFQTYIVACIIIIIVFVLVLIAFIVLIVVLCKRHKRKLRISDETTMEMQVTNNTMGTIRTRNFQLEKNFRTIYIENVENNKFIQGELLEAYETKLKTGGGPIDMTFYDRRKKLLVITYKKPSDALSVYRHKPFKFRNSIYEARSGLNFRNRTLKFCIEFKNSELTDTFKAEIDEFVLKIFRDSQDRDAKHSWLNYQSKKESAPGFVITSGLSINRKVNVSGKIYDTYFEYIKKCVKDYNKKIKKLVNYQYQIRTETTSLDTIIVKDSAIRKLSFYFNDYADQNSGQLMSFRVIKTLSDEYFSVFKFNDDLLVEHIVAKTHKIINKAYSCDFFYGDMNEFDDFSEDFKDETLHDYEYKEFSILDLKYFKIVKNNEIQEYLKNTYKGKYQIELQDDLIKFRCTEEVYLSVVQFLVKLIKAAIEEEYQLDLLYMFNDAFFENNETKLSIDKLELECRVIINVINTEDTNDFGKIRQISTIAVKRKKICIKIKSDDIKNINNAKGKLTELINKDRHFTKPLEHSFVENINELNEIDLNLIAKRHTNIQLKKTQGNLIVEGPANYVQQFEKELYKSIHNKAKKDIENLKKESYPDEWENVKSKDNLQIFEVANNTKEYISIYNRIAETIPDPKIKKIERIQNKRIWKLYMNGVHSLNDKGVQPNETFLFHGTRANSPDLIYNGEMGFLIQFAADGYWGRGIYFAVNASYSKAYAYVDTVENTASMLYVRVALGAYIELPQDRGLKLPPIKNDETKTFAVTRYDSVKGNTNGSDVFIVYDNYRAYPDYLITFES